MNIQNSIKGIKILEIVLLKRNFQWRIIKIAKKLEVWFKHHIKMLIIKSGN